MRLERAMLSYTWVYHGCCDKSRKNVLFVLNQLKNYFFWSVKGVFDVKWREEFKIVGPKALECLLFEMLGAWSGFVDPQNEQNEQKWPQEGENR